MACRRIVKLRRGLLLWPLVGPTRPTARRASVSSTEVSENRILGSNAHSHCPPVAVEDREAIRTTSMMDDCNARALAPMKKSSIAVLSSRPILPEGQGVTTPAGWSRCAGRDGGRSVSAVRCSTGHPGCLRIVSFARLKVPAEAAISSRRARPGYRRYAIAERRSRRASGIACMPVRTAESSATGIFIPPSSPRAWKAARSTRAGPKGSGRVWTRSSGRRRAGGTNRRREGESLPTERKLSVGACRPWHPG
jgi:hypothetical protein